MGNSSLEFEEPDNPDAYVNPTGRDYHGENMEGFGKKPEYYYSDYPDAYVNPTGRPDHSENMEGFDEVNGKTQENYYSDYSGYYYRPDFTDRDYFYYYKVFGFERVVYLYVWEIMVLLTTIANILVLHVFTRKSQRKAMNVILIAVAVSDSLTGLSTLPTYIYAFTHYDGIDLELTEGWCEAFMISKLFVSKSFHTMSIWFTLCLVAQRYIAVKWPFKARTIFTIPKTLIMITIVIVLSPILHIYHLQNKKALQLKCAWELKDPCKEDCAYLWVTFFMMHFIPCTLMIILTVLLIYKMSQTEERLQESQVISHRQILKRRTQNRRISVIVIIIVIIFLIPEIPYGVFLLICVSLKHSGKELMDLDKNRAFHCAYEILLVLNFHANFWVYTAMNRKFRSGLKRTFIPCLAVVFRCLQICGIHKHIQTAVPDDGENIKLNKLENKKTPVYKTEYVVKLDNTQKSNSQLANTSIEIKPNPKQEVEKNDAKNSHAKQTTNEGDIVDKSADTRNEKLTPEDALVTSRKLETRLSTSSSGSSSNIQ